MLTVIIVAKKATGMKPPSQNSFKINTFLGNHQLLGQGSRHSVTYTYNACTLFMNFLHKNFFKQSKSYFMSVIYIE
jgi:hypothetical protein